MARPGDVARRHSPIANIGTALAEGLQSFNPYLGAHLERQRAEQEARRKESFEVAKALGQVPVESALARTLGLEGREVTLPGYEQPRVLAEVPTEDVLTTKFGVRNLGDTAYYWDPGDQQALPVPGLPEPAEPGSPGELARLFGVKSAQGTFWHRSPETGRIERAPGAPPIYTPSTRGAGGGSGATDRRKGFAVAGTQTERTNIARANLDELLSAMPGATALELRRNLVQRLRNGGMEPGEAVAAAAAAIDARKKEQEGAGGASGGDVLTPGQTERLRQVQPGPGGGAAPQPPEPPQDDEVEARIEAARAGVQQAQRDGVSNALIRESLLEAGFSGDQIRQIMQGLP